MTKIIALSQGRETKVDDDDFEYLNQWKWYFHGGYAVRKNSSHEKVILMHRMIIKTPDNLYTDHINGDTLDNRRNNLRSCSREQNMANRKLNSNNESGYKGVYWHKRIEKWQAGIQSNNKQIHLGYFETPEEAAKAYDVAAKELFGEFARTNFD